MFDAMTYLDRKCRGEQWHLLAREAGMPMGQLRVALEAVGADRLPRPATACKVNAVRPTRHPKSHRRRTVSVMKSSMLANGNPESELHAPVTPELDHGRIPAPA